MAPGRVRPPSERYFDIGNFALENGLDQDGADGTSMPRRTSSRKSATKTSTEGDGDWVEDALVVDNE